MLVVPDGIDGLRALDRAVAGELYRLLGICQDADFRPRLAVSPTPNDDRNELEEVNLVFEALSEDDELMLSQKWTLSAKEHADAMDVALRMLVDAASARAKVQVELMQAGLKALERLER